MFLYFRVSRVFVKDLCVSRISIVKSDNAMLPAYTELSISTTQKHLFCLKSFVLFEICGDFPNLCTGFTRHPQAGTLDSVGTVQFILNISQHIYSVFYSIHVALSFPLEYTLLLFFIHGRLVSFLQATGSVLKIHVGCELHLVAGKVHE